MFASPDKREAANEISLLTASEDESVNAFLMTLPVSGVIMTSLISTVFASCLLLTFITINVAVVAGALLLTSLALKSLGLVNPLISINVLLISFVLNKQTLISYTAFGWFNPFNDISLFELFAPLLVAVFVNVPVSLLLPFTEYLTV